MTGTDLDQGWLAPSPEGPLDAVVTLPGSKSLTNRYLVLAALADGPSRLQGALRSRDSLLMIEALRALGTDIVDVNPVTADSPPGQLRDPDLQVSPRDLRGPADIDCGLAGTVMRFLPPVAALADGPVRFDGDAQARRRPIGPVLESLRALGVSVDADPHTAGMPFTVHGTGRVPGGRVTLDASQSSQFVSALLLSGARFDDGVTVHHDGKPLPSEPHIAMTVATLREAGVEVDDSAPNTWRVFPGPISGLDVSVEPDLSNAGPFLAAPLICGGTVTVTGWPRTTTQAGDLMRELLALMGAEVTHDARGLTVAGTGTIHGIDVDLHDASELTPTIAALAGLAVSPTWIRGVAHIRGHETDRLHALATELTALGADVEELDDGLHIVPKPLHGIRFETYHDHRMATAAAIIGLRVPGVVVADVDTTAKTLPGFTRLWDDMLAQVARP